MSKGFKIETGNWIAYRGQFELLPNDEIDFHLGRRDASVQSYDDAMSDVREIVIVNLQRAQENRRPYIMFTHGLSTSRPGKMTARSVERAVMRSAAATPFIDRSGCIQHESVFVAKIRQPKVV